MKFSADTVTFAEEFVSRNKEYVKARNKLVMARLSHEFGVKISEVFADQMEAIPHEPSAGYGYTGSVRHRLELHVFSEEALGEHVKAELKEYARATLIGRGYVVLTQSEYDYQVLAKARELLNAAAQ